MGGVLRRLFTLSSAVSLLVFLTMVVLWVRYYHRPLVRDWTVGRHTLILNVFDGEAGYWLEASADAGHPIWNSSHSRPLPGVWDAGWLDGARMTPEQRLAPIAP